MIDDYKHIVMSQQDVAKKTASGQKTASRCVKNVMIKLRETKMSEIKEEGQILELDPKATHNGEIIIGDIILPCAVLEDGTRLLSERGVTKAI